MYYHKNKIVLFLAIFILVFVNSLVISRNNCSCCQKNKKSSQEVTETHDHSENHTDKKASHKNHQGNKLCECKDDCKCKTICKLPLSNKDATFVIKKTISFDWQKLLTYVSEAQRSTQRSSSNSISDLNICKIRIPLTPQYLPLRI